MSTSMRDRLQADMVAAMKAKDKDRLSVLRMLLAKLKDAAIDARGELGEDQMLRVVMTYAKQREEGLAEAQKLGRADVAAKEQYELELVRTYLPAPLDDAALGTLVEEVIAATGAASIKDMGKVMKEATARAAGRADGGRISAMVKTKLAG